MTEPKYDEDAVNLGYLKKVISDTEENIEDTYKNVSRHYASKPNTPYYKGDTWIDGNIVYTCINSREIGLYTDSDWTTESGAKQEAESKNKTYLTQPSNYSAGDMWILQSDNDHKAGKKGEILISSAGRKEYNADDWTNMLGYGTIRSINEVSNNLNNAINRIGNVEEAIEDGIIITFYQNTVPEAKHIGDLWYVTGELEGYIKGKIYRYDGINWVVLNDPAIQEAFDEANEARLVADGKIQSFYSDTEPTENMGVGDLWIDLANNNQLYRYNGTNWVAVYDTRINDLVTSVDSVTERVTTIETDLGEIDLKVQENTTTITTIETQVNNITNTKGEAEGKNIHITDSAEETLVDISLQGESTQNGTPTPDNPIEIENVEGNIEFKVEGKNVIPIKTNQQKTYHSLTISVDEKQTFCINGTHLESTAKSTAFRLNSNILEANYMNYIPNDLKNFVLDAGKYTLTFNHLSGTVSDNNTETLKIAIYKVLSKTPHTQIQRLTYTNEDKITSTFELLEQTEIMIAIECGSITLNKIYNNFSFNVQLEKDETATDYEPYKSQVETFPLGNQKLMEGSYLADDGIHHTRKQYTFTGNETFVKSVENNDYIRFYSPVFADVIKTSGYETIDKFMCTHFERIEDYSNSKNCIALNEKSFYITISKNIVTDVKTFKTWLSQNHVTVEYDLAEQELVPYTVEQQKAWNNIRALTTYKNVTNISSDACAKIVYMRDNGLDVYETKQNAEKNYTETTKKLAEQKITVDGIVSEVSETKSNINTMNNNLIELNETVSTTEQRVNEYEIKFEEKTKTINEELKENSETIKSMSYTFNTDELSIAKSDDPVNAKINNSGMRVYSYNELKAIFNDKGSGIQKLIVVGSAQLGNLQIVKATDENGEACTDFHHLVSNIQELTDLEVG